MTEVPQISQTEHHRQALRRAVTEIMRCWPEALADTAVDGLRARAYDTGGVGQSAGELVKDDGDPDDRGERIRFTPVEQLALNPSVGVAWLAELGDIVIRLDCPGVFRPDGVSHTLLVAASDALAAMFPSEQPLRDRVYRLADNGAQWWPRPPKKGEKVGNVTVGERTNDSGVCALCHQPTHSGNGTTGRRWVQDPKSGERMEFHKSPCWYTYTMDRKGTVAA